MKPDSGYESYFRRQIELLGKERQKHLQNKKIAIVGCGGLGSTLTAALGGSGIGTIHFVDFDMVSQHNVHRQFIFELANEGRSKAKLAAEWIKNRNPYVETEAFECDFNSFVSDARNGYDLILDATDSLSSRKDINRWAKEQNIPWIYGSVEEFNGQVCFFDRADFGVFAVSDHTPGGMTAAMVMQIASFQAGLALRYLAGLSVKKDTLFYFYYNSEGEPVMQKFMMPAHS